MTDLGFPNTVEFRPHISENEAGKISNLVGSEMLGKDTSSSAMADRPRELGDFKKARVNGGTDNHSLMDSHKCLRGR